MEHRVLFFAVGLAIALAAERQTSVRPIGPDNVDLVYEGCILGAHDI